MVIRQIIVVKLWYLGRVEIMVKVIGFGNTIQKVCSFRIMLQIKYDQCGSRSSFQDNLEYQCGKIFKCKAQFHQ